VIQRIVLRFPYSLVLVMDYVSGKSPEDVGFGRMSATDSCVLVGTQVDADGETELLLTDEAPTRDDVWKALDVVIATPNLKVDAVSAEDQVVATIPSPGSRSRIEVWKNHDTHPDVIVIVVGPALSATD
jgi:hypothetical protein